MNEQIQYLIIGTCLLILFFGPSLLLLQSKDDHDYATVPDIDHRRNGDFYDVQCTGQLKDFCRTLSVIDGSSFLSCALHGTGIVYTKPNEYTTADFDSNHVLKACLHKRSERNQSTSNTPLRRSGNTEPVPPPVILSWLPISYVSGHRHGYDAHERTAGEPWRCVKEGPHVRIQGSIQCKEGYEDCFLRPELDETQSQSMFVHSGTLPQACRPSFIQHLYMQPAFYGKALAGPGILVRLEPSGKIMIELDHGSQEWSMLIDSISTSGVGTSKLNVTLDHDPVLRTTTVLPDRPKIVIAVPMTSRKITLKSVELSPLWRIVIPSLNRLLTTDFDKYNVTLIAGYDDTDKFWHPAKPQGRMEGKLLIHYVECKCSSMVCNTNCIMKVAYDEGVDFMFRINDDSEVKRTPNFLSLFVATLSSFSPPYIGVVGPQCNQGKTSILTHDFVHRSHLEIFNYSYYPTILSNWWCDDWISLVYGESRTRVLKSVPLHHHVSSSRYDVDMSIKQSTGAFGAMLRRTRAAAAAAVRQAKLGRP